MTPINDAVIIFCEGRCGTKEQSKSQRNNNDVIVKLQVFNAEGFTFEAFNDEVKKSNLLSCKLVDESTITFKFLSPGFKATTPYMASYVAIDEALKYAINKSNRSNIFVVSDDKAVLYHAANSCNIDKPWKEYANSAYSVRDSVAYIKQNLNKKLRFFLKSKK
jgi:hypothetical protein